MHACSLIPLEMQDFVVMLSLEFGCTADFAENLMYMSLLTSYPNAGSYVHILRIILFT